MDHSTVSPVGVAFAAAAYDDCIADLDEQIGRLVDLLTRRRILEQTWLIVTADHGESFGEHTGFFGHGVSLYDTELHVPLLIIPPGASKPAQVVKEPVSLRDLAATIVNVVGQQTGSPFPGESLARFWKPSGRETALEGPAALPVLAEVVLAYDAKKREARERSVVGAIKGREWSFIRHEGNGREDLYHLSEDAKEERNLVSYPSAQSTLEQTRALLYRMSGGPLSPERFGR